MTSREIFKNGLFGTLSNREKRLVVLSGGMAAFLMGIIAEPLVSGTLGIIGLLVVMMISINQYNRVKNGADPEDQTQ